MTLPRPPIAIAIDFGLSCVLLDDGEVRCAGINLHGRDRCWPDPSQELVRVELPAPADRIAVSGGAACARLRDGRVVCWGRVDNVRTLSLPCDPQVVSMPGGSAFGGAARLEVGAALDGKGLLFLWDPTGQPPVARPRPELGRLVDLAARHDSVLAVGRDGEIHEVDGEGIALGAVERLRCSAFGPCAAVTRDGVHQVDPPLRGLLDHRPDELEVGHGGGCVRTGEAIQCWGNARPYGRDADRDLTPQSVRLPPDASRGLGSPSPAGG